MTFGPPFPDTEDVTEVTYGPLKVACEVEAAARFAGRLLVIRPGYIVGPHDPTDRFTYWVRRAAAGGEMLAGAPPGRGDPGDRRARSRDVRARPRRGVRRRHVRRRRSRAAGHVGGRSTRHVTRGTPTPRSCGRTTGGSGPSERSTSATCFPMWHPQLPGFHMYDASKATTAGLRPRPFADTIADTLAWDRARGFPAVEGRDDPGEGARAARRLARRVGRRQAPTGALAGSSAPSAAPRSAPPS